MRQLCVKEIKKLRLFREKHSGTFKISLLNIGTNSGILINGPILKLVLSHRSMLICGYE